MQTNPVVGWDRKYIPRPRVDVQYNPIQTMILNIYIYMTQLSGNDLNILGIKWVGKESPILNNVEDAERFTE